MQEDVGSSTEDVEFNNFIAERRRILTDAVSLKTWAVAYGRPADAPVLASATSSGRNYFDRPSAPLRETRKDAAYVAKILADAGSQANMEGPGMKTEQVDTDDEYLSLVGLRERE